MLLFDDLNVVEAIDGEMYLTSLYNFAQPLIRYKISDSLTLAQPTKESPFTRAVGLLGRCEDMLWFEDGFGHRDFLHPLAIEGFCGEGLRDYQFQQTCRDSFVMIAESFQGAEKGLANAGDSGRKGAGICSVPGDVCGGDPPRPAHRQETAYREK